MFHCHVCGKTETRQEFVNEVFDIDGKHVRVENIPATVSAHIAANLYSVAKPPRKFDEWYMVMPNP